MYWTNQTQVLRIKFISTVRNTGEQAAPDRQLDSLPDISSHDAFVKIYLSSGKIEEGVRNI